MKLKTGWYPGTSNHDHHRGLYRDCIGSSFIKDTAKQSPAHAHEKIVNPPDPTPAMTFGSAFHSTALDFVHEVGIMPEINRRTKAGKEEYAHTMELYKGRYIVSGEEHHHIVEMVDSLEHHPIAKNLMKFKDREVTGIWKDFEVGCWCKLRPDLKSDDERIIVDLKSTIDASTDRFTRDIFKFGYHVSAAWYTHGAKMITGNDYKFIIVAVEKTPPYGVNCFHMADELTNRDGPGWKVIGDTLPWIARCVKHDTWPSYPVTLNRPDVPGWVV